MRKEKTKRRSRDSLCNCAAALTAAAATELSASFLDEFSRQRQRRVADY